LSNFRRRRPKETDSWKEKDTCYKVGRARVVQKKKEPEGWREASNRLMEQGEDYAE
jgi:hypothetical protein